LKWHSRLKSLLCLRKTKWLSSPRRSTMSKRWKESNSQSRTSKRRRKTCFPSAKRSKKEAQSKALRWLTKRHCLTKWLSDKLWTKQRTNSTIGSKKFRQNWTAYMMKRTNSWSCYLLTARVRKK
jgi:hypothetical protein